MEELKFMLGVIVGRLYGNYYNKNRSEIFGLINDICDTVDNIDTVDADKLKLQLKNMLDKQN